MDQFINHFRALEDQSKEEELIESAMFDESECFPTGETKDEIEQQKMPSTDFMSTDKSNCHTFDIWNPESSTEDDNSSESFKSNSETFIISEVKSVTEDDVSIRIVCDESKQSVSFSYLFIFCHIYT